MDNLTPSIDQPQVQDQLPKPEFQQESRLGLVVYGGVSLAIYMNGVCREFYNAVRGRGIYKLVKALTDSDIIVDVVSGTSAGGINGVLLSYALTNSDETVAVDFKNFADIWRESGDINQLLRQPDSKRDTNSLLNGEGYYQDRLAEAFEKAWNKRTQNVQQTESEWYSPSSELDLFVTGTDTIGRVSRAFDNTGSLIEVKDHRTVFLLKHRQGRKHPFQPFPDNQQALAKLCRITSCFPVAFPVVTVNLSDSAGHDQGRVSEVDRRLGYWGYLSNRELPPTPPKEGYRLHFVDGGVLDNRPFSYTIRQIYYRVAYRPVTRRLFYIDPSPDRFLGSPKFNQMSKPTIWETVSDSLVGMPRYESIAGDLQDIKERNERVLRYKFLRGTAERTGREKLEQFRRQAQSTDQSNSQDNISKSQQVYLRCRLVRLRDRVLPLLLRIDQIGSSNSGNRQTSQDKQKLLEQAAQLITKYIADQKQQEERETFLHELGKKIRNLDIDYALRKHFFLLEKICQCMTDSEDASSSGSPTDHGKLKQLAEQIGTQIKLLEVIQAALETLLTAETISHTFYTLIDQASRGALPDPKTIFATPETLQLSDRNLRKDTRIYIYEYLLRLHRFLLDADGLVDFDPQNSPPTAAAIDEPRDNHGNPTGQAAPIPVDFFQNYPYPLTTEQIAGVRLQLQQKIKLLDEQMLGLQQVNGQATLDPSPDETIWRNQKYTYVAGSENDSAAYSTILRKIELASEALIQACDSAQSSDLLDGFKSFRFIDEEVYSYEFLADIQAKEQIEVVQISPDASQLGFGKNKGLADKLAGDQLNAFGGFFKKSWRSNDILWGRLDGQNRIIEALLTRESLQKFPAFVQRQLRGKPGLSATAYLDQLLREALPDAKPSEHALLHEYLLRFATASTGPLPDPADPTSLVGPKTDLSDKELNEFLHTLVTAGQRSILKTDLQNVLKDAMAEQIDWSQQLVPPGKQSFKKLAAHIGPVPAANLQPQPLTCAVKPDRAPSLSEQQSALQQLEGFVVSLLRARPQQAQKFLDQNPPERLLNNAFYRAQQIDPLNIQKLNELMTTIASTASIDQLHEFLKRLSAAGRLESKQGDCNPTLRSKLDGLNQQLLPLLEQLKPKYEPIGGYFDRAITPFAIQELAEKPVNSFLNNPDQIDDYFRNTYRVGSEKLAQDVPSAVLEDLLARTGLVLRDILNSPPTGTRLRNTTTFRVFNRILQAFYLWTQSRNPKTSWLPSLLRSIPAWLLPIVVIGGVAFLVSRLPNILLVLIITLAIVQILRNLLSGSKGGPSKPWLVGLLVVLIGFGILIAPRFLPAGTINLPIPLSNLQISIQNR